MHTRDGKCVYVCGTYPSLMAIGDFCSRILTFRTSVLKSLPAREEKKSSGRTNEYCIHHMLLQYQNKYITNVAYPCYFTAWKQQKTTNKREPNLDSS